MTYREITDPAEPLDEQKPLTPQQAMARSKKIKTAQASLSDVKKKAAIDIAAKSRAVSTI